MAVADLSLVRFTDLPLAALRESTWNPRKHFDVAKLEELAESIRAKGVLEPILVRPTADDAFEIVAGARRFRASKLAGLATVPAVVRALDDVAALEVAIIENQQRADVNPLDEAAGYMALKKLSKHYTVAVVAAKVGKSESYVYRRLRLLDLEDWLQTALAEDRLTIAHAERLLRLTPEQRAVAADPDMGVVWTSAPLLNRHDADMEDGEWVPQASDLRPLHVLDEFIRMRTTFDPRAEDTRHLQPTLAQAIDAAIDDDVDAAVNPDTDQVREEALAQLVELSADPMVRSRLGVDKSATVPLPPSRWREVAKAKDRCEFTVRGVITHGGAARVLDVCVTKRCAKHFPPAPKPKKTATTRTTPVESSWEREARLRKAREADWAEVWPEVKPLILAHLAPVTMSAALLRRVLEQGDHISRYALDEVEELFGVVLNETTLATAVALVAFTNLRERKDLEPVAKAFGLSMAPVDALLKAAAARRTPPADAKPATKKKARRQKKGRG